MPCRRNLVIVRCGDTSLHPHWLAGLDSEQRNWDLVVNYFGNDPDMYSGGDWIRVASKGPKWPALHQLITDLGDTVQQYESVWLPDDDLDCTCRDVNRLFEIFASYRLSLAQPALTPDSYISHVITRYNPLFRVRFTSMIEVMAPCFDRETLMTLLPTFSENLSGWGLDSLWPKLVLDRGGSMAIIDEVQVRHTRPIGAANYGALAAKGITALEEADDVVRKYNVPRQRQKVFGGVPIFLNFVITSRLLLWPLLALGLLTTNHNGRWTRARYFRGWLGFMRQQVLR